MADLGIGEAILIGISLAGTGLSVASSLQRGSVEQKQNDFHIQQDLANAKLAEKAAIDAESRGTLESYLYRAQGTREISAARAGYAASNLEVNSGTLPDVYSQDRLYSELNAKIAINNAAREAFGFRAQATQYRTAAEFGQGMSGDIAAGTLLGAGAQAVGGLASAYGTYRHFSGGQQQNTYQGVASNNYERVFGGQDLAGAGDYNAPRSGYS